MGRIIGAFLKDRIRPLLLGAVFFIITLFIFFLYSARLGMVLDALTFCLVTGMIVEVVSFVRYYRKYRELEYITKKVLYDRGGFPETGNALEQMYQEIVLRLSEEKQQMESEIRIEKKEMEEYYMLWVHQIKTPIAAMNLLLQSGEADERELSAELFKIEQYVEMVLGYLRAGQMASDLSLHEYVLSDIVKRAVRKYSRLFILQKIGLHIEETDYRVVTDEKWLLFCLEQILSNALKYTKKGSISIYMEEAGTLVIEDTGIGIGAEDLPRVVEKGFTGYNGRNYRKSTGLGLYLTKEVLTKLGHTIRLESEEGQGTKVLIGLNRDAYMTNL